MKLIGLTGGIGSGKSTVSAYLAEKGCKIIDADGLSREMTQKGNPCLQQIRETFGDTYFLEDGSLNRKKMGELVFRNTEAKAQLETIITHRVMEKVRELATHYRQTGESIVILDAPLLFECGMQGETDRNWLVTCELSKRLQRVAERDGLDPAEIKKRMENQMSEEEKRKIADVVIDNSEDPAHLYRQVDVLLRTIEQEENRDEKK